MHFFKGGLRLFTPLNYARFGALKQTASMWQRTAIVLCKMSINKREPTKEAETKEVKNEGQGSSEKTQRPKDSFWKMSTSKKISFIAIISITGMVITLHKHHTTNKMTEEATPVEGNRRLFTISSSSSFVQYMQNKSYISKMCDFEDLKDKTEEELKTGVMNMMQFQLNKRELKNSPGDYSDFLEYLAKRKYTLRDVVK